MPACEVRLDGRTRGGDVEVFLAAHAHSDGDGLEAGETVFWRRCAAGAGRGLIEQGGHPRRLGLLTLVLHRRLEPQRAAQMLHGRINIVRVVGDGVGGVGDGDADTCSTAFTAAREMGLEWSRSSLYSRIRSRTAVIRSVHATRTGSRPS